MMEEYFSLPTGDNLADDLLETCMRAVIRDLPKVIANPQDYEARTNLEWASSLAENRLLKSGKTTCFQCHMIEHQIGAYTDCVQGLGLAAFTADYYRRIFDKTPEALQQFKRFAVNVWGVDPAGKTDEEVAREGIEALDAWTREVGAHRSLSDLGLREAVVGQDAVFVALTGDLGRMARCVVEAMDAEGVKRLIFISSMGIYNEIPAWNAAGNLENNPVLKTYREAADVIEASDLDYTIIRPGWYYDGGVDYRVTRKGEPFAAHDVSRKSIADLAMKLIAGNSLYSRDSVGISD